MNTELDHTYKLKVEFAHLDSQGYIKPHGYQHLIGRIVDEHLENYHVDFNSCMEKKFGWVVVSLHFKIEKHVQGCANLHVKTWHSERKRIYFRREVKAFDDAGDVVFLATIYSVLMDLNAQAIHRKEELPFKLVAPHPEITLDVAPVFKQKLEYNNNCERTVLRSYIDAFGHVNNCRYGEFAFDALSDKHADLSKLNGFSIYFCSELRLNEIFMIEESIQDKIVLHGYNKSTQKTSFYCEFFMENV